MKKSSFLLLLLIASIFFATTLSGTSNRTTPYQTIVSSEPNAETLESSTLCDITDTISIPYSAYDLTFLDGSIWMTSDANDSLFQISPIDGAVISSFPLIDYGMGLTTDGTVFYISFDFGLFKYALNGTLITMISDDLYYGLAWDGEYLWGTDATHIYRINPTTGAQLTTYNVPMDYIPLLGLTWAHGLLWSTDLFNHRVLGINPANGLFTEAFDTPDTDEDGFGLTYNGLNLLFAHNHGSTPQICTYDWPTEVGDIFNIYGRFPSLNYIDITSNGSHYLATDGSTLIVILHHGTLQYSGSFSVPFNAFGITMAGNVLYISGTDTLYECTLSGSPFTSYPTVQRLLMLTYDGTYLWGLSYPDPMTTFYLQKLNPSDGSSISNYSLGATVYWGGIAYDSRNEMLWVTCQSDGTIKQIAPRDGPFVDEGQFTGFEYTVDKPTEIGTDGPLFFTGEHLLIFAVYNTVNKCLYKLIIGFPVIVIPGFSFPIVLLAALLLGIVALKKKKPTSLFFSP
ncbi:MAG TPA: hypothetical protein VMV49_15905 [Candidatus Deferrimicrobium sp.]|nr:hypothetical protein [Candidatus Deferrimicrobium sp.]